MQGFEPGIPGIQLHCCRSSETAERQCSRSQLRMRETACKQCRFGRQLFA
jgi:hypothetical protein